MEGDESEDENDLPSTFRRVLIEIANITLLYESYEQIKGTDWYNIARTTFNIGYIGLLVWSVYLIFSWALVSLSSASGLSDTTNLILTYGPFVPVLTYLFAVFLKRGSQRLEDIHTGNRDEIHHNTTLFLGSVISLIIAGGYRWSIYAGLNQEFGDTLSIAQLVSTMLVDGLYICLVLLGVGGLASLYLAPDKDDSE